VLSLCRQDADRGLVRRHAWARMKMHKQQGAGADLRRLHTRRDAAGWRQDVRSRAQEPTGREVAWRTERMDSLP